MATLTTPVLGLPYPDGAERVMDGDNAIGALANAVDGPLGRAAFPDGAIASGPSAAIAAAGRIQLNTLVSGSAASVAANALLIAKGGLYLCIASGISNPGAAATDTRITLRRNGTVMAGVMPNVIPAQSPRWECSTIVSCVPGDELYLQAEAAYTHQITRFQILKVGTSMNTLLRDDRDEAETTPAEEPTP